MYNVIGAPAGVVAAGRVRPDEQSDAPDDHLDPYPAQRVDHRSAGLPVGVQVVGPHWHDHIVLAVMAAIEQRVSVDTEYPSRAVLPI